MPDFKTIKSMKNNLLFECEQSIIDFAKKKDMSPSQMLSIFQTALLNVAGWVCQCYQYTNEEYEKFMRDYANNVTASIEGRFKKE